jgi:DNA-binding MarR family transcriptional regulator
VAAANQGQGRVLALLKLKPELTQKELSTILDVRSQSLGELLAKLERQGCIVRTPSAEDRRSMNIQLTEAGKVASEQQESGDDFDNLFQCLDENEQRQFGTSLERIIQSLEAELGPDGPWARPGFGPPPGDAGFGRHGQMRGFGEQGFGPIASTTDLRRSFWIAISGFPPQSRISPL